MNKEVMLFYANWCSHCVKFKPLWDDMKKKYSSKKIQFKEFEDKTNPQEMKMYNIQAFPTIKIKQGNKVNDYNGLMNPTAISSYLGISQEGGNSIILSEVNSIDSLDLPEFINYNQNNTNVNEKVNYNNKINKINKINKNKVNIINDIKKGGKNKINNIYYLKYLKYKQKYLKLSRNN